MGSVSFINHCIASSPRVAPHNSSLLLLIILRWVLLTDWMSLLLYVLLAGMLGRQGTRSHPFLAGYGCHCSRLPGLSHSMVAGFQGVFQSQRQKLQLLLRKEELILTHSSRVQVHNGEGVCGRSRRQLSHCVHSQEAQRRILVLTSSCLFSQDPIPWEGTVHICTHSGWVLPPQLIFQETPLWTHLQVCLHGDFKFSQVANEDYSTQQITSFKKQNESLNRHFSKEKMWIVC